MSLSINYIYKIPFQDSKPSANSFPARFKTNSPFKHIIDFDWRWWTFLGNQLQLNGTKENRNDLNKSKNHSVSFIYLALNSALIPHSFPTLIIPLQSGPRVTEFVNLSDRVWSGFKKKKILLIFDNDSRGRTSLSAPSGFQRFQVF